MFTGRTTAVPWELSGTWRRKFGQTISQDTYDTWCSEEQLYWRSFGWKSFVGKTKHRSNQRLKSVGPPSAQHWIGQLQHKDSIQVIHVIMCYTRTESALTKRFTCCRNSNTQVSQISFWIEAWPMQSQLFRMWAAAKLHYRFVRRAKHHVFNGHRTSEKTAFWTGWPQVRNMRRHCPAQPLLTRASSSGRHNESKGICRQATSAATLFIHVHSTHCWIATSVFCFHLQLSSKCAQLGRVPRQCAHWCCMAWSHPHAATWHCNCLLKDDQRLLHLIATAKILFWRRPIQAAHAASDFATEMIWEERVANSLTSKKPKQSRGHKRAPAGNIIMSILPSGGILGFCLSSFRDDWTQCSQIAIE